MPRKFLSFFPQSIAPQPLTSCNATPLLISARPHATMQAGAPPNQTLPIALNIARLTFRLCHDAPPSMLPSHLSATACNSAPALRRPHTCADRTVRIITGQLGKEASMLTGWHHRRATSPWRPALVRPPMVPKTAESNHARKLREPIHSATTAKATFFFHWEAAYRSQHQPGHGGGDADV
jgi:hypothetical protein